jgi:hypothetical protein
MNKILIEAKERGIITDNRHLIVKDGFWMFSVEDENGNVFYYRPVIQEDGFISICQELRQDYLVYTESKTEKVNLNTYGENPEFIKVNLLSIEAWKNAENMWDWNNIAVIERNIFIREDSEILTSPRKAIRYFREYLGVLNENSKGKVKVDLGDHIVDGVLIEIQDKNTGEPLFALSSLHG